MHGLISVLDRGQFVVWQTPNWERGFCGVIAKFHYTDPRGPERTGTDFVGDPHGPTEFLGDPRRARLVEFSYNATKPAFPVRRLPDNKLPSIEDRDQTVHA